MEGLSTMGISPQSILIYLAGYGILFVILFKLLYKPINTYLEKRQSNIKLTLEEVERIKSEFQAKFEAIKDEKDRIHAELSEKLANTETLLEQKRLELINDMEAKRAALLDKTQKEIQTQKDTLISSVEGRLKDVIAKIIMEITYNQVPQDVIGRSVSQSWNEYKKEI